ncbi:MAG: hypothetical protein M3R70_12470 [Actinomycetota bacterium]|nr:hypothetical protein [Actinomycetota bacterium]
MASRLAPAILVLAAVLCDRLDAHGAAFGALLLALPFSAAVLLAAVGDLVDGRGDRQRILFAAGALGSIVFGAAARSPVAGGGSVPTLAQSALVACVVLFCAEAALGELRPRKAESSQHAARA